MSLLSASELLAQREAQILTTTDEDRENYAEDGSNPIIYAEGGPNRFALMSLFFTDNDGVRIEEDLETGEVTVAYFTDSDEVKVQEGPLWAWAIDYYQANY